MFDGKAFGEEMTGIVKRYVDRVAAPLIEQNAALVARVAALEGRSLERGEPGRGVDGAEIRDGILVLRLSDGQESAAGKVTGDPGRDGPTVDEIVRAMHEPAVELVRDAVEAAVAALPAPEKGEPGEPGKPGATGDPGQDGCGIKDMVVDRDGALVVTFDDGRMKNMGVVIGRDGEPGKDGRDGFSLDDFDCEPVDERSIKLMFTRGDVMHSFELEFPVIIYRDVFKAGESYARGDAVTWGGSLWIALRATDAKPDSADSGWRLAVKKGRDGKDAK